MKILLKSSALILSVLFLLSAIMPLGVFAAEKDKVVRVGWYESPFNITDEYGRRSGYAYEYQQKIAAYTGWTYEYVYGSWPNLLQMLKDGKIDLLSDVSYTEERTETMLFSSLPMGEEEYYLFIAPDNTEISFENIASINGKRVGVNKGSIQEEIFKTWSKDNGISAEIVELTTGNEESVKMLKTGRIDILVLINGYLNLSDVLPIGKIGGSDFFFAVSKNRPELMDDLNFAMRKILSEDQYYNLKMMSKYIKQAGSNLYLSEDEKNWLDDHGKIRVGYQDNYLAFCAKDPETNELTGALKDYLQAASDCLKNVHIEFETICYPTASAAMEALKNGDVDCMFPANLTDYDGEIQGYIMTAPIMRTDISAIVLESESQNFMKKEHITVAVNAGNPNYDMFLIDNFPEWRSVIFKDTPECLKAIKDKKADCLLISNYRYNNIAHLCRQYGLVSISTGVEMDYSFAVRRDWSMMYSILNKIAYLVPDSTVNAALTSHFTKEAGITFGEMLLENVWIVLLIFAVVAVIILFLILNNVKSKNKADFNRNLVTATQFDSLTGLYNKNFFYAYADSMYKEDPKKQMDAAVINIEQFHSINALHGWDFGDNVIRALGDEINAFVNERGGIGGHAEADRFAIYFPHTENYGELFERLQNKVNELSQPAVINLRMGIMPWKSDTAPRQMIEQALLACSLARGKFKEHMVVFDNHVREIENHEQRLKMDLERGILEKEFEVHYQPKYDIQTDPPTLSSVEALVRWRHHEFGMILPGDFIPLFERSGQISMIDRYVCEEAAAQVARWKKEYGVSIPVSVNISRVDIFDPNLEKRLDELIEKNGLSYKEFKLEITESAYIENSDEIIRVIGKLRDKGFEIEMDDFGTGYSSLSLLTYMPVNALKMDRSFIKNVGRNDKDDQMVEVVMEIAKKLKLPVIAEGVENEQQLQLLKNLGCEMVQGFYFSRPLPSSEFENIFLKK